MITGLIAMLAMTWIGLAGQPKKTEAIKQPEQLKRCVLDGKKLTCWREREIK